MKPKSIVNDSNGKSQELSNSPGHTTLMNSPFKTPVSAKGGRTSNKSKVAKEGRSGPQTPISNAGEKIPPLTFMAFDEFVVIGNNLSGNCIGETCIFHVVLCPYYIRV